MEGVAIHYPAFGADESWPRSHDDCIAVAASIIRQHAGTYNPSPAYNWFVCPHGLVIDGRTYARLSGANGTTWSNLNYWAICVLFPIGMAPTDAAKIAVLDLAEQAPNVLHPVPLRPHSDFVATSCCGDPWRDWIYAGAPRPSAPAPRPPIKDGEMVIYHNLDNKDPDVNTATGEWFAVLGSEGPVNITAGQVWIHAVAGVPVVQDVGGFWGAIGIGVMAAQARKNSEDWDKHAV